MKFIDGWLDSARRCPSPNFNQRPESAELSLLVIHNISLPPGKFGTRYVEDFFLNQLDSSADPYFKEIAELQVSAHFFIRRGGEILQFVSLFDRAWHAGQSQFCGQENCNDYSIGIELEGTDDLTYEPEQYASLTQLTKAIMHTFPLITPDRIVGHSDIAPGRKTDPGESFNWDDFRIGLKPV